PIILFGITGGVSISKLFTAGIVPGVLIGVTLAITWGIVSRKDKVDLLPKKSVKEKLIATKDAVWALLMPIIIIVGLRGGVFTPTEAGVVAVFYALIVGFVIYRELKLKDLFKILLSTAQVTSVVVFLIGAAMVSAWLI